MLDMPGKDIYLEAKKIIIDNIQQKRDPFEFQKYDRSFHRYPASLREKTYIISTSNTIWDLSDWTGAGILLKWGGFSRTADEHSAIFEFLAVRAAKKTAAAMEAHLNSTESRFLGKM